jgi:hypothetical protein
MAYGSDPLQFGELRLPRTKGPHPLAGPCEAAAKTAGDQIETTVLPRAGHFVFIDPQSDAAGARAYAATAGHQPVVLGPELG